MFNPVLGWNLILAERTDAASEQRTASAKTEFEKVSHGLFPSSSKDEAFQWPVI
jgi:hypothetical protein